MEITVFGIKINLVTLVISLLIGLLIGATTLCSCVTISNDKNGNLLNNVPHVSLKYNP